MNNIITAKNLRDAADLIEIEDRWTQGTFEDGDHIPGYYGFRTEERIKCKDTKFCALGAMAHVKGLPASSFDGYNTISPKAAGALADAFGIRVDKHWSVQAGIIAFNDEPNRQAKTVAKRFRKAADLMSA